MECAFAHHVDLDVRWTKIEGNIFGEACVSYPARRKKRRKIKLSQDHVIIKIGELFVPVFFFLFFLKPEIYS